MPGHLRSRPLLWSLSPLVAVFALGCGDASSGADGGADLATAPADAAVAADLSSSTDAASASPDLAAAAAADLASAGATGETCTTAIDLVAGNADYTFDATRVDTLTGALLNGAGCTPTTVLQGPDIAFRYKAASTGTLQIQIDAASDFAGGMMRVAGLLTTSCDSPTIDTGACASVYSTAPSVKVSHAAVAGATYYLWVAKTDSSPNTFAKSQVTITVTEL